MTLIFSFCLIVQVRNSIIVLERLIKEDIFALFPNSDKTSILSSLSIMLAVEIFFGDFFYQIEEVLYS